MFSAGIETVISNMLTYSSKHMTIKAWLTLTLTPKFEDTVVELSTLQYFHCIPEGYSHKDSSKFKM